MIPLRDQILVTEIQEGEEANKSAGGIILAEPADKGSSKPGLVLAVGEDVKYCQPGSKIALEWGKGLPVMVDNVRCLLISEEFVRAVYTEDN